MKKTLLSMAPLPVEELKSFLAQLSPGVADTDVIAGHDMSAEELAKAFAKADVVLGDYTFKQGIGRELLAKAGPLKLIQQPSVGYQHIDIEAFTMFFKEEKARLRYRWADALARTFRF